MKIIENLSVVVLEKGEEPPRGKSTLETIEKSTTKGRDVDCIVRREDCRTLKVILDRTGFLFGKEEFPDNGEMNIHRARYRMKLLADRCISAADRNAIEFMLKNSSELYEENKMLNANLAHARERCGELNVQLEGCKDALELANLIKKLSGR